MSASHSVPTRATRSQATNDYKAISSTATNAQVDHCRRYHSESTTTGSKKRKRRALSPTAGPAAPPPQRDASWRSHTAYLGDSLADAICAKLKADTGMTLVEIVHFFLVDLRTAIRMKVALVARLAKRLRDIPSVTPASLIFALYKTYNSESEKHAACCFFRDLLKTFTPLPLVMGNNGDNCIEIVSAVLPSEKATLLVTGDVEVMNQSTMLNDIYRTSFDQHCPAAAGRTQQPGVAQPAAAEQQPARCYSQITVAVEDCLPYNVIDHHGALLRPGSLLLSSESISALRIRKMLICVTYPLASVTEMQVKHLVAVAVARNVEVVFAVVVPPTIKQRRYFSFRSVDVDINLLDVESEFRSKFPVPYAFHMAIFHCALGKSLPVGSPDNNQALLDAVGDVELEASVADAAALEFNELKQSMLDLCK